MNGFTNLFAMEIDPKSKSQEFSNDDDDDDDTDSDFLSDLTSAIPGIDEAVSFGEMLKQINSLDYSCVLFDTAPTGHTLRLLNLPNVIEKGLDKLLSLQSSFGNLLGQFATMFGMNGLLGGENGLFEKLASLKTAVEEVNSQFKNPTLTTFVCVCIPDFLSLYETERLVQELATYEIDSHNIVINQIIYPDQVQGIQFKQATFSKPLFDT